MDWSEVVNPKFPHVIDPKTNILRFNKQYVLDRSKKLRESQFFMCVVSGAQPKRPINWDATVQKGLEIQEKWKHSELMGDNFCIYWQVDGYDNLITRPATTVKNGKNIGKKNATNPFTQTYLEVTRKMEKKYKQGARLDSKAVEEKALDIYFPQLLQKFDPKYITDWNEVSTQPKLDGLRATHDTRHKKMYSRTRKELEVKVLNEAIKNPPKNIIPDGEVFHSGMTLQEINRVVRGQADDSKIEFHIFDAMLLDAPKTGFLDRYKTISAYVKDLKNPRIKMVPIERPKNLEELMKINQRHIAEGYEGTVVRLNNAPYCLSKTKAVRTTNVMKLKPILDAEYKVVDFTHGEQGDAKDMIIWILETPDGKRFKSNPTGTIEERKALLKEAQADFAGKFKNKMGKIKFYSYTEDKIPFHSNFLGFRDPE